MILPIVPISAVILGFIALGTIRAVRKYEVARKATFADADAGEAFTDWRRRTGGCAMHSTEGRALLLAHIDTYEYFLETHSFVTDHSHLEFLYDLLYTCRCGRDDVPSCEGGLENRPPFLIL